MTRNPSSKHSNRKMEVDEPKSQELQLSGAYIRSLVKQLSTSRTKDPTKSKSRDGEKAGEFSQNTAKDSECLGESRRQQSPTSTKPSLPKKQVRRRLHTSRPYQERLLNMAEARREIVAALKLHRASMKQANEQQQLQQKQQQWQQQRQQNPSPSPTLGLSPAVLEELQQELNDYRRNTRIYLPNYTFPNYNQNANLSPCTYASFPGIYPPITPLSVFNNLNTPLPNQPLGLNLNLQSFNNVDNSIGNNINRKPSIQLSSAPTSSSSSSPTSIMSSTKVPCISKTSHQAPGVALDPVSVSLHPMMDDDEIAKIRLMGEQHDMEWNDRMNLMTSAWWSNFLKNMEGSLHEREEVDKEGFHMFNQVLNMPTWLSNEEDAMESCLFQQHMSSYCSEDDYLHDAALPW